MNREQDVHSPPEIIEPQERPFREQAINRLIREHDNMLPEQFDSWMRHLQDSDPYARAMAVTAVWAMMDVRDARIYQTKP